MDNNRLPKKKHSCYERICQNKLLSSDINIKNIFVMAICLLSGFKCSRNHSAIRIAEIKDDKMVESVGPFCYNLS